MKNLSKVAREQLALALILLKDWKCEGRFDIEITLAILELADHLGIKAEYDALIPKIPPMRIEPR